MALTRELAEHRASAEKVRRCSSMAFAARSYARHRLAVRKTPSRRCSGTEWRWSLWLPSATSCLRSETPTSAHRHAASQGAARLGLSGSLHKQDKHAAELKSKLEEAESLRKAEEKKAAEALQKLDEHLNRGWFGRKKKASAAVDPLEREMNKVRAATA